jgi:hypothetical protein
MEFLVIYEFNHKENEMFIHYCQWAGNEAELTKLMGFIERADWDEMGGDYSSVSVARNKRVPESAVDAHIGLEDPNGYSRLFEKHTGKFVCPDFDEDEDLDDEENRRHPHDLASDLDRFFYGGSGLFRSSWSGYRPR